MIRSTGTSRLRWVLVGAALAVTPLIMPRASEAKPAAVKVAGPSHAVTEEMIDAIAEEMNRAMAQLEIPGLRKPYDVSYKITEVEVNDVVASLGQTTSKNERHFVNLEARVRVGSLDFDNANFVVAGGDGIDGVSGLNLPLEATPRIARRAAWLVTDQAYKEALIQLRAKEDARKAGGAALANVPSWTAQTPLVAEDPVTVPALERADDLEVRAQKLSAKLRGQPQVRDSRVAFTSYLERRWYLNSSGTSVADTRRASGVTIVVLGQAADGQELSQYFMRYGQTAGDLPSDAELDKATDKLAGDLGALMKAPVIERYSGPVLFEGEGAAGIIRNSLAPHLGGTPLPEGLRPSDAKQFGGALRDKVGLRVLPPFLSIVDDPTAAAAAGKAMIGGYKIDDEGVPSQKVDVIKNGMLTSLLTSRTPAAKGAMSNGHARRTAAGGMFHGSATNLIVTAKGGLERGALVKKLLAQAKADGLPYALIIRRFDDAALTATPEMTRRELLQMIQNSDMDLPPPAVLAYKVFANGKEELVRGVQLAEVPIKAWKDVMAAGKTPMVFNFLAASDSQLLEKVNGVGDGNVPSSGIESAVVTPDLLFKELDVASNTTGQRPQPAIPAPSTK